MPRGPAGPGRTGQVHRASPAQPYPEQAATRTQQPTFCRPRVLGPALDNLPTTRLHPAMATPGRSAAGDRRCSGPRSCRPAARMPRLRHGLPGEGLSPACDRDAVWPGHGPIASVRFRCAGCGTTDAGVTWPLHARSTPELDRMRAQLSALMTYRTAAEILGQMFPVDSGAAHETLRRHTFKVAERLSTPAAAEPATPSEAIVVTLDSTFIRSCEAGERHVEVRIG